MASFKVVIVCLAAMLVLPSVLTRKGRKGQGTGSTAGKDDDGVWLIATGNIGSRETYVDPISGEQKGFEIDVLRAVCEIAGRECRLVETEFPNCWDTIEGVGPVGGFGLFNFYFDACIGYTPTYTRARTFKFSESFTQNRGSVFIVPTNNSEGFDWTDLTGKTIGLVDGLVSDDACILRASDVITGAELSDDQIIYYSTIMALVQAVMDGEVDAGFDSTIDYPDGVEVASDPVYCGLGGSSIMTRKDNTIIDWFNPALEQLLASDGYQQICDNLTEEHGDIPGPDPEDICIQ